MKNFMLCLSLTPLISIVFWNVENCFDYKDSGYSASDAEFSSRGTRHWTRKRFEAKTAAIGKTLLWAGLPDIVGVAEVENAFVLKSLCRRDVLRKYDYGYVHFDSPDPRGIDVGLLYRRDRIRILKAYPLPVEMEGKRLNTRDILYACAIDLTCGDTLHLFVNHHPSKYGGKQSGDRRIAAMRTLVRSIDSLLTRPGTSIVAMGDFNDGPSGPAFGMIDSSLVNLGRELIEASPTKGNVGTIRYNGNWELIDNFLVSPGFYGKMKDPGKTLDKTTGKTPDKKGMEILRPPFLLTRDKRFPGEKPYRTYVGPRYNGGVSDHLPVRIFMKEP